MSVWLSTAITITLVLYLGAMAVAAWRLFHGPAAQDRVLALMVAWALPLLMAPLRPRPGPIKRWGTLLLLIAHVGIDVVRSAIEVAGGVLRLRGRPPRSAFVVVPLDLRQPHALAAKLSGHYGYYGRTGNFGRLWCFYWHVTCLWRRWLSRRSDKAYLDWAAMNRLLERYPLPKPSVVRARLVANP